jgi:hypothetical protein
MSMKLKWQRVAISLAISALLTWVTIWGFLKLAPGLMTWASDLPPMWLKYGVLGLQLVTFVLLVWVIVRRQRDR